MDTNNLVNYRANKPEKVILTGKYVKLEPLNTMKHGEELWHEAGKDDNLWKYLTSGSFERREDFIEWLQMSEQQPSRTYYTCTDKNKGNALGALSLMDFNLEHGRLEIGGIFFGKNLQKTRLATESIFLLLNYSFESLRMRRVEWRCNSLNEASRNASKRFGFTFEGKMRSHMVTKGASRDTLLFSMIQDEWANAKKGFIEWLNEDNFDENEIQKKRLTVNSLVNS
jgi:RimJ/RimL family protein N-acetyltransferase